MLTFWFLYNNPYITLSYFKSIVIFDKDLLFEKFETKSLPPIHHNEGRQDRPKGIWCL